MYKVVKTPSLLEPFLDEFAGLFTKPSYISFRHLIIAIAVCAKSKTISNLHETISNSNVKKKSRSSYNWFFDSSEWDENKVAQQNAKLFFEFMGLNIGDLPLLIIDDTYNEKKESILRVWVGSMITTKVTSGATILSPQFCK